MRVDDCLAQLFIYTRFAKLGLAIFGMTLENQELFDLAEKFGKSHTVHIILASRRFQNCINHFFTSPQCRENT